MKLVILCMVFLPVIGCVKKEKQEGLYIRGRLFLTDTITQHLVDSPLPQKVVKIAQANGDSLNYLYSKTTDSAGYFVIDLPADGPLDYVLRYEEKLNGYRYYALDSVKKGETNIALMAQLDVSTQNGFVISTQDSLGGIFPLTSIYIFNGRVGAELGHSSGAYDSVTSSAAGKAFKFNITAGVYWLNASKKIDTIVYQRVLREIKVPVKGIVELDSLQLLKKR